MKVSKSDRTKVIALAAVLALVWIFLIARYVRLSQHWEAKAAEEHQKHEAAAAALAVTQPLSPTARLAAMVEPVQPPIRDPFHPRVAPRAAAASAPAEAAAEPSPVPVLDDAPTRPSREGLHVTGIVLGTPSTAVLRVGERHFVVREGDTVDDGLRVQSIDRNRVTLLGRHGSYTLRLGQ